jgi:hypothetical protein
MYEENNTASSTAQIIHIPIGENRTLDYTLKSNGIEDLVEICHEITGFSHVGKHPAQRQG